MPLPTAEIWKEKRWICRLYISLRWLPSIQLFHLNPSLPFVPMSRVWRVYRVSPIPPVLLTHRLAARPAPLGPEAYAVDLYFQVLKPKDHRCHG
jgi:hypothetical protein